MVIFKVYTLFRVAQHVINESIFVSLFVYRGIIFPNTFDIDDGI